MNKKHFLIYYDSGLRQIVITTPRTWAKGHKNHFSQYSFIKEDHPTDTVIEKYLENKFGFIKDTHQDFVVLFNFNQSIPPSNNLTFI